MSDFGEDLAEALVELRQLAESRMRGTCTAIRPGPTVIDDNGDESTPHTLVYRGKFYARYPGVAFEQNFDVAGADVAVSRLIVRVPFGTKFAPGDIVRFDAEPDNPQLVGTLVQVASIDDMSQATAQRLLCNDFQSGVNLFVDFDEGSP